MKNQKGFSSLIGVAIVIAVVVIASGGFFAYQYYSTPKENNQPQVQNEQQNQNTENATDQTASWKTCTNTKYGYELKYPVDWKVYKPGAPEARIADCSENLDIIAFSPDIFKDLSIVQQFTIDVSDPKRLEGTIYAGAKSLNDYFSKNPLILQTYPIVKETKIDGERMVMLKDGRFNLFHNNILFDIRTSNLTDSIIDELFSTFKFTK